MKAIAATLTRRRLRTLPADRAVNGEAASRRAKQLHVRVVGSKPHHILRVEVTLVKDVVDARVHGEFGTISQDNSASMVVWPSGVR